MSLDTVDFLGFAAISIELVGVWLAAKHRWCWWIAIFGAIVWLLYAILIKAPPMVLSSLLFGAAYVRHLVKGDHGGL